MTWKFIIFVWGCIVLIATAAMTPMYLFAQEINEDEYLKSFFGMISAVVAGGGLLAVGNKLKIFKEPESKD